MAKKMTKQTPKEANELYEIWKNMLRRHSIGNYQHLHHYGHWEGILLFWHLKAKMDAMKEKIKAFEEHLYRNELTPEDFKEILSFKYECD